MSLKVKLNLRRTHDGKHQHYTCPKCPYKTKKRRQFKAHQFLCGETVSTSSSDTDIVDSFALTNGLETSKSDRVLTDENRVVNDALANGDAEIVERSHDASKGVSKKRKIQDDEDSDDHEISLKLPNEDAISTFSSDATEIQDNNDKPDGSVSSAAAPLPPRQATEPPPAAGAVAGGSGRAYARTYRCKYPRCEFETKNSRQFLLHERSDHYQDFTIYVCDIASCEYSSKWLDKVLRHRAGVHSTKAPWKGETLPSPSKTAAKQNQVNETRTLKALNFGSKVAAPKRQVKRRKVETTTESERELNTSQLSSSIRVLGHGSSSRFQCTLCGYTHVRRHQLKVHLVLRHFNTKQFQCTFPDCSYVCQNKSELFLHKNLHSDRTMSCQECDYTSVLKANLERHYNNHKLKNPPYRCNICTYGGLREANVVRHLNEHHYKSEEKRVINFSAKPRKKKQNVELKIPSFKRKYSANVVSIPEKGPEESQSVSPPENQAVFPGLEVERSSMSIGGREFVGPSAVKPAETEDQPIGELLLPAAEVDQSQGVVHAPGSSTKTTRALQAKNNRRKMRKPHKVGKAEKAYYPGQDGMLCCRFCEYKAKTMFKMRAHMSVHSRKGNVQCSACAYKCRRNEDLHRHVSAVHGGDVTAPLMETAGTAPTLSVKSDPSIAGPSQEPAVHPAMNFSDKFTDDELICKSCSYIGKFPSDLQKHMASAHDENKQYACAICHRRYRWQQDLTNHTRMAHEGKIAAAKKGGTKRFNQRRSARKRRLTLKRRTNLKPNEMREQPTRLFCRLCDYVATCRTHLIRHAESHSNKVAYHCEVCGYATQRKSDIKRHLEKYHSSKYSSEFLINLYIEKLEEDVIDGIMDHERSVEALCEGADLDLDDDNQPVVQDPNLPATTSSELVAQPDEPTRTATRPIIDEPTTTATRPIIDEPTTTATRPIIDEPTTTATRPIIDEPTTTATRPIIDEPLDQVAVKVDDDELEVSERVVDTRLLEIKSEPMSEDECKYDLESLETKSSLSDHQSEWYRVEDVPSTRKRRFCCNLCDYSALRIDYITYHCSTHENLKRYLCTVCGQRLNHRAQMYSHVSSAHSKVPSIKADMMSVVDRLSHEKARETLEDYHRNRLELSEGLAIKYGSLPTTPIVHEAEDDYRTHKLKQSDSMMCCPMCPFYSPHSQKLDTHIKHVHGGQDTSFVSQRLAWSRKAKQGLTVRHLLDVQRQGGGNAVERDLAAELIDRLDRASASRASTSQASASRASTSQASASRASTSQASTSQASPVPQPGPDRARRYKCSLCSYRSNQYDDTEGHIDKQHPYTRVAHVDILPLDEALATLDAYEKAFHGKDASMATWGLGTKRSSRTIPLPEHSEAGGLEESYQCPKCDFKDENSNLVKQHIEMHRCKGAKLDLKMLTCSICFFTTNYHNSLYRHIKYRHKVPRLGRKYVLKKAAAKKALNGEVLAPPKETASRTAQVLKSFLTPEAKETGAKVAHVETSDLDNLPKGTRIYRCSICAFTTPWLATMEGHIGQTHADKLSGILRKATGGSVTAASSSSSLTLQQAVRLPMITPPSISPLTPPSISPTSTPLRTLAAATSQLKVTSQTQLELLTSALQLTATSSRGGLTSPEKQQQIAAALRAVTSPAKAAMTSLKFTQVGRPCGMVRPNELKFLTTTNGRLFLCTYCPYRHEKPQHLADHLQFHSPHASRPTKCSYCPYWVKKPYHLNRHTPLHKNQQLPKPVKHTYVDVHACDTCPYYSRAKEDLESHRLYHCTTGKVKCDQCLYSVSTLRHLTQHAKVHTQEYKQERERLMQNSTLTTASTKANNNNNNTIALDNELGRNVPSTSGFRQTLASQQPLRVKISMQPAHKTTGQKMMSPSKQGSTYDPVLVASLKHDIVNSRITPAVLKTLPSDEDLVAIPIAGKNASNVDVILHKNKEILHKRQRLTRCRYCPYSHIMARSLERHEAMHGLLLEEQGRSTNQLFKCPYCDHYSTTQARVHEHEKVHCKTYVPNIDDVPQPLAGMEDSEKKDVDSMKPKDNNGSSMGGNARVDPDEPSRRPSDIPFKVEFDETRGQHVVRALLPSKLSCERCPYGTTNRNQFERHVTLHGSRQLYTCQFCDYSVESNPMLQLHTKLHLKPNRNLLQVQTLNNLTRLAPIPADEAVALRTNGRTTDDLKDPLTEDLGLHGHLDLYENVAPATASKGKERQRFLCNRCPFSTIGECWLTMHIRCHGVHNVYTCPYCDYSCTQEHLLNTHIKLHFLPKDSQGLKAKNKDVFVRSHSIEQQLDVKSGGDVIVPQNGVGEGTINDSDVAAEMDVVKDDVIPQKDVGEGTINHNDVAAKIDVVEKKDVIIVTTTVETTENVNSDENKIRDITAPDDLTNRPITAPDDLNNRPIQEEKMEVDAEPVVSELPRPKTRTENLAPEQQASTTLAKSFAEFAASAVLMSPDRTFNEPPKFTLNHRVEDATKESDNVNALGDSKAIDTDCEKNEVNEVTVEVNENGCNVEKKTTLGKKSSEERSEITVGKQSSSLNSTENSIINAGESVRQEIDNLTSSSDQQGPLVAVSMDTEIDKVAVSMDTEMDKVAVSMDTQMDKVAVSMDTEIESVAISMDTEIEKVAVSMDTEIDKVAVSMDTDDKAAGASKAEKLELGKSVDSLENTESTETVKNKTTDPVEKFDGIVDRNDCTKSSDNTITVSETDEEMTIGKKIDIEKSALAMESVPKSSNSVDISEPGGESSRNKSSTPSEQQTNSSPKTVTIVSDVPLPLKQEEGGHIGRPNAHAQDDCAADSASFNCPYCERSFTNSAFLQKHTAQHLIGNHYYYYYD